jgi:hypothetical protein
MQEAPSICGRYYKNLMIVNDTPLGWVINYAPRGINYAPRGINYAPRVSYKDIWKCWEHLIKTTWYSKDKLSSLASVALLVKGKPYLTSLWIVEMFKLITRKSLVINQIKLCQQVLQWELSIMLLKSSIMLLELSIMLLESLIILLESLIMHLVNIYSTGVTHEAQVQTTG